MAKREFLENGCKYGDLNCSIAYKMPQQLQFLLVMWAEFELEDLGEGSTAVC